MSELLPCPFCGGEAHTYKNNLWHVACERAHNCCVTMSAFITEAEAIEAWNTRAGSHCAFAQPTDLTDSCALVQELEDARAEIRKLERRGEYMVRQIAKAKEALR